MGRNELVENGVVSPSRRRLLRGALATTCLFGVGAGYAFGYEPDDIELVRVTLDLAGGSKSPRHLRVGHLSDMHCYSEHACHRTDRAVRMLLAEKPDVVVLTGDYISDDPKLWAPKCAQALAPLLSVPGGVYATLGNHDWGPLGDPDRADLVSSSLAKVGITVLRNAAQRLPNGSNVWLVGLDDLCFDRQDVGVALKGVPSSAVKILLVHEPDYADQSPAGFALQLSGHSHGGQIRIPGFPPSHLPQFATKYYDGLYHTKSHPVYTTRGIGTVGIPVRTFCPPEVTVLDLSLAG